MRPERDPEVDGTGRTSTEGGVTHGASTTQTRKGGTAAEQALYQRIGGRQRHLHGRRPLQRRGRQESETQRQPAIKQWNESGQLPGLKFMRTLWLCQQAGGPFEYTGKEMGEAHKDLHITSEEFDEVGAEIARALDHLDYRSAKSRKSWRPWSLGRDEGGQSLSGLNRPTSTCVQPTKPSPNQFLNSHSVLGAVHAPGPRPSNSRSAQSGQ